MEVHPRLAEGHLGTGLLGQKVGVDRTGVLEVDDELVGVGVLAVLLVGEDLHDGFVQADGDELAALGEALAGAQVEGHALPARVVDPGAQRDERLGRRVGRDAGLVEVPLVLAAEHRAPGRATRSESKTLLISLRSGLAVSDVGCSMATDAEHLEEVGDDHVAKGAGRFVERPRPSIESVSGTSIWT